MVRIVKVTSIGKYIASNQRMKGVLEAWVSIVQSCTWQKPQDMLDTFGAKAVDIIGEERAVIDIKGNHLRVIVKYQFHQKLKRSVIYIKWIGNHAEYDKICKAGLQYTVEMFK